MHILVYTGKQHEKNPVATNFVIHFTYSFHDKYVWIKMKIWRVTHRLGTQRRTVLSLDDEATRWLEGENCTDRTASLCPLKW